MLLALPLSFIEDACEFANIMKSLIAFHPQKRYHLVLRVDGKEFAEGGESSRKSVVVADDIFCPC